MLFMEKISSNSVSVNTRRITIIAMLATLSFVGRVMFTFLPNVQPTTVIILMTLYSFGLYEGLMVANLSMLISNIFLGMGPWTIPQMIAYSAVALISWYLFSVFDKEIHIFVIISAISGILYGLIISLVQIPMFGWGFFVVYYLNGVSFDVLHAIGNVGFAIILFPLLEPLFRKYKNGGRL